MKKNTYSDLRAQGANKSKSPKKKGVSEKSFDFEKKIKKHFETNVVKSVIKRNILTHRIDILFASVGLFFAAVLIYSVIHMYPKLFQEASDSLVNAYNSIHVGWYPSAKAKAPKSKSDSGGTAEARKGSGSRAPSSIPKLSSAIPSKLNEGEIEYLSKLSERRKELDFREAELSALEEELNSQKMNIEKKIKYLKKVRAEISDILKNRVEIDQEKIKKIVSFYSGMKPEKAAKVLSGLDEDLAVEVFGQMKKKNAAAILNLLEPKKARLLSEKYTGYK